MTAPCCPSGSHGPLPPDDQDLKGWWEKKADVDCYFSGKKEDPKMIILGFADVFGAMSGRHRRVCDELAEAIPGSLVCLPDLFHGDPVCQDFAGYQWPKLWLQLSIFRIVYRIRYYHNWEKLGPKIQALANTFGERSALFCFGFCFGGYLAVKASSTGLFRGVVGFHPSLIVGRLQCSPHSQGGADLANAARCPHLMLPASNDDAAVKPGGEFMNLVTAAYPSSRSVCYENMVHGWMTRAVDDPVIPQPAGVETVRESHASAVKLAADFFVDLAKSQE